MMEILTIVGRKGTSAQVVHGRHTRDYRSRALQEPLLFSVALSPLEQRLYATRATDEVLNLIALDNAPATKGH